MKWTPCQRIVQAEVPVSFRVQGVIAPLLLYWPSAYLGSGADYSVDFSFLLGPSDRISVVEAIATGGQLAWSSAFGSRATLWIQWLAAGLQTVTLSVRTALGAVLSVTVSISIICAPALIFPAGPDYAPNAFLLGSAIVPDSSGNPLIFG
ncbi:hypothetical protein HKD28_12460 [Gluconobacter sp. LMG 1744]|uniref:hypothetical protein n=1 Tax=Gluconobacter cadivus TaxID=2728101 RepID=UPI001884DF91|nr:hypothetical protein [Gluconobacter cadivus]MBF0892214.1 hypothetical protein [Gluconobacter cadivus]